MATQIDNDTGKYQTFLILVLLAVEKERREEYLAKYRGSIIVLVVMFLDH